MNRQQQLPAGFKPERPNDPWYMRSYVRGWNQLGAPYVPMPPMPGDLAGHDLL